MIFFINIYKHFTKPMISRMTIITLNLLSSILARRRMSSVDFLANIISNGLYQANKNNIVAKTTTELVILFHKNITKLVSLWSNMSQKNFQSVKGYQLLLLK